MTTFESTTSIKRPVNEIYLFLSDLNNHKQLMPENIENWVATADEASFDIKNLAKLNLQVESRIENQEIKIIATQKPPFALALKWTLSPKNDQTGVLFTIEADLNMMMTMLVSGQLQKLADNETESLLSLLKKRV